MSAIFCNCRMQVLRTILLGTGAALLFLPTVAGAITWNQVASYYDGGTYVWGKFKLMSNTSGSVKKLKYKVKSDVIPLSDGLPCTLDEVVCETSALFNFSGTPRWIDIVTRPDSGSAPWMWRVVDLCVEMPALCAPGVTVIGGVTTLCYAPDPLNLPPPAFTYPMTTSTCEGAYDRPLLTLPLIPSTLLIIY